MRGRAPRLGASWRWRAGGRGRAAALKAARRRVGPSFTGRTDLPVYPPDGGAWEVRDSAGDHVGICLHDNFARAGKQSGAWSSRYRDQETLDGAVAPIVVNNN